MENEGYLLESRVFLDDSAYSHLRVKHEPVNSNSRIVYKHCLLKHAHAPSYLSPQCLWALWGQGYIKECCTLFCLCSFHCWSRETRIGLWERREGGWDMWLCSHLEELPLQVSNLHFFFEQLCTFPLMDSLASITADSGRRNRVPVK